MRNTNVIDNAFGQLRTAVDQFYRLPDKDDVSRTVAIAHELALTSNEEDRQKAVTNLRRLDFGNYPYCEEAKAKILKILSSD